MNKNNNKNDITEMHYASWLENALEHLTNLDITGLSMVAIDSNGNTYTNYYNISMGDKLVIAGLIQQDAMMDTLAANGMIESDDDEDNCEDDIDD